MDVEAKHFYWACAVVLVAFILSVGFGHCNNDSPALEAYRICADKAKDVKDCKDPFASTPTPEPKK